MAPFLYFWVITMKQLYLILALPLLIAAQIAPESPEQIEPVSWPELITFDQLAIQKEHYKQSYNTEKPGFLEEKVKVETKMYPVEGPTGHGLYTTIYYLPAKDVFYLQSDCEMGHADGFLGPFAGNPKMVLAKN